VLRAAHELNYRPNLISRSLRTKITHTIALVSDTIASEQYAGQAIYGSLAAALKYQQLLFVGEKQGDPHVEARLVEDFLDRQVDGFVYGAMYTRKVQVPPGLRGHPLVLLNCISKDRKVPAVIPDELAGGRTAAETLRQAGHRERIYLVGERAPHHCRPRAAQGHRIGDERGGHPVGRHPVLSVVAGRRFRGRRPSLGGGAQPTALICLNDRIAFGAYQALQEVGLAIPDEVSIVSFDDSELASWPRPQLTSVALPHYQLGWRAVELLLADQSSAGIELVPMPLRQRSSVAPPGPR
jgi:LacI family transcriptional regulator